MPVARKTFVHVDGRYVSCLPALKLRNLSLDHWKSLSAAERERTARQLGSNLPTGFTFDSVFRFNSGMGDVATFTFEGRKFAFIPGGTFELGFDAERHWSPTVEELESWQATAQEYGFSESIHERILAATLRPRQVELAPFLIETAAQELGWQSASADDPEVREALKKYKNTRKLTLCRGERTLRIEKKNDGAVSVERSLTQTHAESAENLRSTGFRFPTSDEWEFACGCGKPTLFRWGDHAPCDRYPIEFGTKRVKSAGGTETPKERFSHDWDLHVKPNGFGLSIASNPYFLELVAEIGTTRGGDGGCTLCGGYGFFVGWLTLATAYFEEHSCKHDTAEPISPGYTIGRRVLELR